VLWSIAKLGTADGRIYHANNALGLQSSSWQHSALLTCQQKSIFNIYIHNSRIFTRPIPGIMRVNFLRYYKVAPSHLHLEMVLHIHMARCTHQVMESRRTLQMTRIQECSKEHSHHNISLRHNFAVVGFSCHVAKQSPVAGWTATLPYP